MDSEQYQTPPQAARPPPGGHPVALSSQRPRGRTACSQCSRRKIRCDAYDRQPLNLACTNCTKRGQPGQCTLNDDAPRSGTKRTRTSTGEDGQPSPAAPRVKKDPAARAPSQSFLDGIHSASASTPYPQPPNGYPADAPAPPNTFASKAYNVVPTGQWPQQAPPPHPQFEPRYSAPPPPPPPPPPPAMARYGSRIMEINELLPAHKSALRFFDVYKTICHPIYPVITDLEEFEAAVCQYVEDFSSGRLNYDLSLMSGRNLAARLSWLALLTATIATGVQFSDLHVAERDSLTSRHVRNTSEILRQADHMGRPDENCIGAMLLLTLITENDLMPEAAWTSLGSIGRMVELAGLQNGTNFNTDLDIKTREVIHLRHRKLWWSYLWQEAGLALCFGKSPVQRNDTDEPPISTAATLTYNDCMLLLCKLAIQAKSDELVERSNLKQEIDALAAARHLHDRALPRLADRQNCRSAQDRIEYYSLRISQGSIVSCMSQTLMKASSRHGWEQQRAHLVRMCKEGAIDCLQAFVDMQSFTVVPFRNWMFSFNALSAALVLAALADDSDRAKIQGLQKRLLDSFAERDQENELPHRPGWYTRYPKAMGLLRHLSQTTPAVDGQTNGSAQAHDGQSKSPEADPGPVISDAMRSELLDPSVLWKAYFSADVAGESYPLQQISSGT